MIMQNIRQYFFYIKTTFFLLIPYTVFAQRTFSYKEVPEELVAKYYNKNKTLIPSKSNIFKIPASMISNNAEKNTMYIQSIIDNYEAVLLPNLEIPISLEGLYIRSNRNIYFDKNTLITFKGIAGKIGDDIIKIYKVSNVKIYNAKIRGSRSLLGQRGEWSAGISVIDSDNILIDNAYIYETWGDGIFIGSENLCVSRNVTIRNVWIDRARRNGISITSAINVKASNILLSNTHGTLPECGIDIEPSFFEEYIQDIHFKNLYGYNNNSVIFNVNLSALNSDTRQYPHKVSITLDDFVDEYSYSFIGENLNNFKKKYTPHGCFEVYNGTTHTNYHNLNLGIKNTISNVKLIYENLKRSEK